MIKTEIKRAVAYLRVSSMSQVEGHSLAAQERLFGEICRAGVGLLFESTVKRASRRTPSL